jgi:glutamyl-tRNA synthetase
MTKNMHIRTRFAPSPTGFVHLGNIRSAIYPWAFAKHHQGTFILRIEDTDIERSSQEAVDVILQGLAWLGMHIDEGPFYQTQRMYRYQAVIEDMLNKGLAYHCYTSEEELNAMREAQQLAKQKPKYDGTWRPEPHKILPQPPNNTKPVVRFKNPLDGEVTWIDAVKGKISIQNQELDDFIIARADGMPTYNFCVVIDDIDMQITHVIRGDDHINNTPRQINLLRALSIDNEQVPIYAHLPTVLNASGEKMSKRNGAKHIMTYKDEGYLPQAVINYLARLGWSHGNDEIFTTEQFIEWFDLNHLGASAVQFDENKLKWLNTHYIKQLPKHELCKIALPFLQKCNYDMQCYTTKQLEDIIDLLKDRAATLVELAEKAHIFYHYPAFENTDFMQQVADCIQDVHLHTALKALYNELELIDVHNWHAETINTVFKKILTQFDLKMPALAMPSRLMITGTTQTPSIDKVLEILGQPIVLSRLAHFIN